MSISHSYKMKNSAFCKLAVLLNNSAFSKLAVFLTIQLITYTHTLRLSTNVKLDHREKCLEKYKTTCCIEEACLRVTTCLFSEYLFDCMFYMSMLISDSF